MKRKVLYGLFCGALAAVLALMVAGAALAGNCSIWWDPERFCGQGQVEYDGAVFYDFEVFQSPISVADTPGHYALGRMVATQEQVALYMNRSPDPTAVGYYHADSQCYTDWDEELGSYAHWFCYDGEDTVRLWYGRLKWTGFGYALQDSGWLYRMDLVTVSSETGKELRRFITPRRADSGRRVGARVRP